MLVSIVSDCVGDPNGKSRFEAAVVSEIPGGQPVCSYSRDAHEAAGNLVDQLRRTRNNSAIMLGNVAPRANRPILSDQNGSDFCYFWLKNKTWPRDKKVLVLATQDGRTLSLLAKLFGDHDGRLGVNTINLEAAAKQLFPDDELEAYFAANSQYRGVDFMVPATAALWAGKELESKPYVYDVQIEPCAWTVDEFGNVKTTYLWDVTKPLPKSLLVSIVATSSPYGVYDSELPVIPRLCDIQRMQTAVTIGSSGYGQFRFLEIATRLGRAEAALTEGWKIESGTSITFHDLPQ